MGLLDSEPALSHLLSLRWSLCSHILKEVIPPFLFSSSYLSALGSLPLVTSLPLLLACGLHRVLACIVEVENAGSGSHLLV